MFADGLVDEVRCLLAAGPRRSDRRSGTGYAGDRCVDAGGTADAPASAHELTFSGTRRYVRRQRSWFRRDHRIRWLDGSADDLVAAVVALGGGKYP